MIPCVSYDGDAFSFLLRVTEEPTRFCTAYNLVLYFALFIFLVALVETGADVATVNALERVDNSCLVSANQLGQLKVWDLRCGLEKPQQRLLRCVYFKIPITSSDGGVRKRGIFDALNANPFNLIFSTFP